MVIALTMYDALSTELQTTFACGTAFIANAAQSHGAQVQEAALSPTTQATDMWLDKHVLMFLQQPQAVVFQDMPLAEGCHVIRRARV